MPPVWPIAAPPAIADAGRMVREVGRPGDDPFAAAPDAILLVAAPLLAVGLVIEVCLAVGLLDQPLTGFQTGLHALLIASAGGLMILRATVVREERAGWFGLGLAVLVLAAPEGRWLAGLVTVTPGDAMSLWQAALGTSTEGTLTDAMWSAGLLAIGAAAWQPSDHARA